MTDRPIIYSLEQIRSFDTLWGFRDLLTGIAYLAQTVFGTTGGFMQGFVGAQTSVPSLTINLGQGFIYEQAPVDSTAYGALSSDSQMVTQSGFYAGGTLTFTPTLSAGQSLWALVEVTFQQLDEIRVGDPTNGILPYVNTQNPAQPLQGQNGNGLAQNTERAGIANIEIKYGVASSSSPVAPTPDAGYLPLYLINLTHGQTAISTADILVAGPAAYSGYQNAPLFPGVTGQIQGATSGSHHGGIAGQAAQIQLAVGGVPAEVTGIMSYQSLPVSNTSPPAIGGDITVAGDIPIFSQGTVNPNSNVAGNQNDLFWYTTEQLLFVCTTSGSSSTAVWGQVGSGGLSVYVNSFPLTVQPGNFTYLVDTSAGAQTISLLAASAMGGTEVTFVNIGANTLTLACNGSENIISYSSTVSSKVLYNKGDSLTLSPRSGVGYYTPNGEPQGGVPAGMMAPWWNTATTVPTGWHLCDGSTVTWQTGPNAGSSITLPNTIGMFVLGSQLTSGSATPNIDGYGTIVNQTVGGTDAHDHSVSYSSAAVQAGSGIDVITTVGGTTGFSAPVPLYLGCPWIIKL